MHSQTAATQANFLRKTSEKKKNITEFYFPRIDFQL